MKKPVTKLRVLAFILCMLPVLAFSQQFPNAYTDIDVNNIRARVRVGGDHFWDLFSSPKYEVPKITQPGDTRKHTMCGSALWVGGMHNNDLYTAAMTYRQSGSDFWAGPLNTKTATTTAAECSKWDKIFEISKIQIEQFKSGHGMADVIKYWPAHGDTSIGQAYYLAPFVDMDGDGTYNPYNGDYPRIKGDFAAYFIFNDAAGEHSETGGKAFGIEIHALVYAFSSTDEILNNTIFFDYDIYNRSKRNYNDVYMGLWTDIDLGYGFDDFMGSDISQSAYYGYNGDPDDEGVSGYGSKLPVQSVVFLNQPIQNFLIYTNDFTAIGNPASPQHYYNFLKGVWKDGKAMRTGGDGYSSTGDVTTLMYNGNPLDDKAWHERSAGNKPGDRRGVGSIGPVNLYAGDKYSFHFAYVTTFSASGQNDSSIAKAYKDIAHVKNYYNNNLTGINEKTAGPQIDFKIYPNPAQNFVTLQWNNASVKNVRLINALGQTVHVQNTNGLNSLQLDTKHFSRGVYMVVIQNDDKTGVQRLVLE